MSIFLTCLFAITAVLYASVGFGGGSTYNALLALSGTDFRILPAIALACNIIVVSGGVWRFSQTGDLNAQRLAPYLIGSVPAAWLGGQLPVSETVFIGLLGGALLLSGSAITDPAQGRRDTNIGTDCTLADSAWSRLCDRFAVWAGWHWWWDIPRARPLPYEMGAWQADRGGM